MVQSKDSVIDTRQHHPRTMSEIKWHRVSAPHHQSLCQLLISAAAVAAQVAAAKSLLPAGVVRRVTHSCCWLGRRLPRQPRDHGYALDKTLS